MSLFITAYQRRTCTVSVTVTGSDGNPVTFASGDVMRCKIGSDQNIPTLDLDSVAPTDDGSSLTPANPTTLRLAQGDLVFTAGIYDIEFAIVDDSDSDAIKHAEKGVFALHATQTGDVALT